jgi:hypothetical protein
MTFVRIAVFTALAFYFGQAGALQLGPPSSHIYRLTDPRIDECALWTAVEQLARQARWRIGFEATSRCHPARKTLEAGGVAVTFEGTSPIEALDGLLRLSPEFSWRDIGGTVVVRPTAAWTDPTNALNTLVGEFSVLAAHPHFAVHAALEAAQPSLLVPHTELVTVSMGRPLVAHAPDGIALQFGGGTLIDALNGIVGTFEGVWQVGYTGKTFHVVLHTFDFQEGSSIIPGAPSNLGQSPAAVW